MRLLGYPLIGAMLLASTPIEAKPPNTKHATISSVAHNREYFLDKYPAINYWYHKSDRRTIKLKR